MGHETRNVMHAAVADLHVVLIKDFVKLMVRGEVFVVKAEKFIGYVCLDVLTIYGGLNQMTFS